MASMHRGSNQVRYAEELAMARKLHVDCAGYSRKQLIVQMQFRNMDSRGDRLVYSV